MDAFTIPLSNAPAAVLEWIAAHPGQTALYVVEGVIILSPAAMTGPLLAALGWGAQGPIAGSIAAWIQSTVGPAGAHGLFAYLQSAAMGGYGVAVVNGVTQGAAAVAVAGPYVANAAGAAWGAVRQASGGLRGIIGLGTGG